MSAKHEVFFSSGDPSGDLHAALMAQELTALAEVRLTGIGGRRMRQAGFELYGSTEGFSAIGVSEALPRYLQGLALERRMARRIRRDRPALLVLVDFPAFNMVLSRDVRPLGRDLPIIYYFPPASWRRRQGDWSRLRERVDVVATPFPWSAEQLRAAGIRAYWVGHPVLDRFGGGIEPAQFRREEGLPEGRPVIGLMAGSRRTERRFIGPRLVEAARQLHRQLPEARFLWSVWDETKPGPADLQAQAEEFITPVNDSRTLILGSDMVLVASGTATLECAAARRPMVVVYHGSRAQKLQGWLMKLGSQYCAMPNIIAQRSIVPELVFDDSIPERIAQEALRLIQEPEYFAEMTRALGEVRAQLGHPGASRRTAQIATAVLQGGLEGLPDTLEWPRGGS